MEASRTFRSHNVTQFKKKTKNKNDTSIKKQTTNQHFFELHKTVHVSAVLCATSFCVLEVIHSKH